MYNGLLDAIRSPIILSRDVLEHLGYDVPSVRDIATGHLPNIVGYEYFQTTIISTCDRLIELANRHDCSCYNELSFKTTNWNNGAEFYGRVIELTLLHLLYENGNTFAKLPENTDFYPSKSFARKFLSESYCCVIIHLLENAVIEHFNKHDRSKQEVA
jgi:hypothetical protein